MAMFVFLLSFCFATGMRQKAGARTALIEQLHELNAAEDISKKVKQGAERVEEVSCDAVREGLHKQLIDLQGELDFLCTEANPSDPSCQKCECTQTNKDDTDGWVITIGGPIDPEYDCVEFSESSLIEDACWPNMTKRDKNKCPPKSSCPSGEMDGNGGCTYKCHGKFDLLPSENKDKLKSLSSSVATAIMVLDEKRCLKTSLQWIKDQGVSIGTYKEKLQSYPEAPDRVKTSFGRLASWQESLAAMGTNLIDRRLLFPEDIENAPNCPRPCTSCTKNHNSLVKGSEADKFKCLLDRAHRNTPPSVAEKRLKCEKPRRRMWKFWQYKTWCNVPGWVADAYLNARVAAMVACGSSSILTSLRGNKIMTDEEMRVCMLVEQRMAVTEADLQLYQEAATTADDGVLPEEFQHIFGIFLAMSTAEGLVGMRDTAPAPPSDDDWLQFFRDDNYTLVPQGLVPDVSCEPPVNNRELLLGNFAAILSIGSGVLLSVLVVIPLLYITALLFLVAVHMLLAVPGNLFLIFGGLSVALLDSLPQIAKTVFTGAMAKVYNIVAPRTRQEKACPKGLLTLGSGAPVCIKQMDKLEAARYQCPGNASRSIVVSCEPTHNGVVVVRGEPCK